MTSTPTRQHESGTPPRPRPAGRRAALVAAVAVGVLAVAGGAVAVLRGGDSGPSNGGGPGGSGGTATAPSLAPRTSSASAAALVPERGAWFGAWVKPATKPTEAETRMAAARDFEARIGRPLDIEHRYYTWRAPFPTAAERADVEADRIPYVSWNGDEVIASIIAGDEDALIAERADALRDLDRPLFLRWAWEMDAAVKSIEPEDYIEAWRHLVDIFRERGATNVAMVWCPTALGFANDRAQKYYPGDDYVDWICADGYASFGQAPLRPFKTVFQPFYDFGVQHEKPLMIGEFGSMERGAGEKGAWLRQAQETLKQDFPAIRAIVYFESERFADGQLNDWRIGTSPESQSAFTTLVSDPYFDPPPPPR